LILPSELAEEARSDWKLLLGRDAFLLIYVQYSTALVEKRAKDFTLVPVFLRTGTKGYISTGLSIQAIEKH
jgi:hypothetical protein